MNDTEIVEALRYCLRVAGGRHLYGVLGSYPRLEEFATVLAQTGTLDGDPFPTPISVIRGILDTIPDDEFRFLVENEAKRPEPTAAHIKQAFESFLRSHLGKTSLLVLSNLELLFAYHIELGPLRTLSTDQNRVILLLPGRRAGDRVIMFPELAHANYALPRNLIAENHLWQLE